MLCVCLLLLLVQPEAISCFCFSFLQALAAAVLAATTTACKSAVESGVQDKIELKGGRKSASAQRGDGFGGNNTAVVPLSVSALALLAQQKSSRLAGYNQDGAGGSGQGRWGGGIGHGYGTIIGRHRGRGHQSIAYLYVQ